MNRISSPRNSKFWNFCLFAFLGLSAIGIVVLIAGFVMYRAYSAFFLIGVVLCILGLDFLAHCELTLGPHDPNYYPGPVTRLQQYESLRGAEILSERQRDGNVHDNESPTSPTQE